MLRDFYENETTDVKTIFISVRKKAYTKNQLSIHCKFQ